MMLVVNLKKSRTYLKKKQKLFLSLCPTNRAKERSNEELEYESAKYPTEQRKHYISFLKSGKNSST